MGCFFLMNNKPNIKIFDLTSRGVDFNYLRPGGTITLHIDRKYQVALINIRFDGWYENSVRLWPKHTEQNRENIFCCFKEHLHHHLVFLRCLIVVSILFFSLKKNDAK